MNHINSYNSSECDFKFQIDFHPNLDFHLGNGEIPDGSIDFQLTAARAITFGLGFHSNIRRDYTLITRDPIASMVEIESNGVKTITRMSPMDSLIYTEPQLGYLMTPFNIVEAELQPISKILKRFEKLGGYKSTHSILQFIRIQMVRGELGILLDRHLEIRFHDGTVLPIKMPTFGTHIVIDMVGGPEFLMQTLDLERGRSLQSLLETQGHGNIYGPLTLKLMQHVGYATIDNPKTVKFAGFGRGHNMPFTI